MRQRKVKHEAERLAALAYYAVEHPEEYKGRWQERIGQQNTGIEGNPNIYLELGCGRGKFLADLADAHRDSFFLGAEGRSSIVLRAMELIHSKGLPNVLLLPVFLNHMEDFFAPEELSGIYLNFSDPWPKFRHAKRRLTHRSYLTGYRNILKPGSYIEVKTDNVELFQFTLEESEAAGLELLDYTYDLHKTDLPARLITTQYEYRFQLLGKPICYCKLRT